MLGRGGAARATVATACWSTGRSSREPRPARRHAGHGVLARRSGDRQGRPGERRRFLDDALVCAGAEVRRVAARARPRRQATQHVAQAGRRPAERRDRADARRVGLEVGRHRRPVRPRQSRARRSSRPDRRSRPTSSSPIGRRAIEMRYEPAWRQRGLARCAWPRHASTTCAGACRPSARIATTSSCSINGMPARTHASQGEQRTLALALRLAAHRLVTDKVGSAPVLVLDDVLSELDPRPVRGAASSPARGPGRAHHRRRAARSSTSRCDAAHRSRHGDVVSRDPVPIGESLDSVVRSLRPRRRSAHPAIADGRADGRRVRALGRRRRRRGRRACQADQARRNQAPRRGRRPGVGDAIALLGGDV